MAHWAMHDARALYDLFTAGHEYDAPVRDRYGRVPYYTAPHRSVFTPAVSAWLHAEGFRAQYPGGHAFAACLSHDLDLMLVGTREKLGSLRRGILPWNKRNIGDLFRRRTDPRYSVEHLLKAEDAVGAGSSFYLLALEAEEEDQNYALSEVADQLAMLRDAGREVGLHGGHRAYADEVVLAREKKRLEHAWGGPVVGYRNHFLRFEVPETWHRLQRQGFTYDTTYGHSDCAGFRNGMAHPFRPFDRRSGSYIELVEVPLVLMDAALLFNMKLAHEDALRLCHQLIDEVQAVGGVVTLLWHNNYMQGGMGRMYHELVEHLHARGAWLTSTQDLVQHWVESGMQEQLEEALQPITTTWRPAPGMKEHTR